MLPTTPTFLRLRQIIGDKASSPPVPPIIPIGKTAWWAGVKTGRFPKPIKLAPRITVWRASEVFALFDQK